MNKIVTTEAKAIIVELMNQNENKYKYLLQ
jgi:hypothetical protein